jgi:hypothetical protein
MSREKQIEEMANIIGDCQSVSDACCDEVTCAECKARRVYNAGYRKQSEDTVKHGTWYHGTENGVVYAKCSACGKKMNYSCYGYAYCSLCGARMDGAKMKGGAE